MRTPVDGESEMLTNATAAEIAALDLPLDDRLTIARLMDEGKRKGCK